MSRTAPSEREPRAGGRWQAVALPPEHGSWGLVGEPVVLGLLAAAGYGFGT